MPVVVVVVVVLVVVVVDGLSRPAAKKIDNQASEATPNMESFFSEPACKTPLAAIIMMPAPLAPPLSSHLPLQPSIVPARPSSPQCP